DGGAGWNHGSGGAAVSDWEFGAPAGLAGDPDQAAEGAAVAGTDLGRLGNGAYDPGTTTWLESPPVSCGDCAGLTLHIRRVLSLGPGDTARITVGGQVVWEATGALQDPGWIDQAVDLSAAAGAGSVQVRFELESDGAVEAG